MLHYLTAAKIAYLTLIEIYCQNAVPDSAVVEFLSFVVECTSTGSPNELHQLGSNNAPRVIVSIEELESLRVLKLPSTIPGRSLYDLFVRKLWEIDSLDALHECFQNTDKLFPKPETESQEDPGLAPQETYHTTLSRSSPLGLFVRRVKLEFTRLQFSDALQLWLAFIKFKEPSSTTWRRLSREPGSFDRVLQDLQLDHDTELGRIAYENTDDFVNSKGVVSTSDVERVLEFQLEKMQQLGNRVPWETRTQLREMLSKLNTTPSLTYFLQFFDTWRAGDYHSSFDNLHRYFDHTLQAREKTYYQYALLHMAILHADFGCFSEAIAAMNEAIATARENQDIACLNFCLNWLYHLRKAYPREMRAAGWSSVLGGPEKDSLVFLKSKAKEMKMWPLLSSTLLGEAEYELSTGESLSRVFEHVYQSSHVITQHNVVENIGAQLLVQSSLYARMGFDVLAGAYCEILSDCYRNLCPRDEIVRTAMQTASNMTMYGQYREAQSLLQSYHEVARDSVKLRGQVVIATSLVNLVRAIRRSDNVAAEHSLLKLKSAPNVDPATAFKFHVLMYEYQLRNNNYDAANSTLDKLAEGVKSDEADIYHRIEVAILKAQIFVHAGIPERAFTIALRAAAAAQRVGINPSLWSAVHLLCTALVSLEEYKAAISLLDAVIPPAHEGKDFALIARLYNTQADAHVALLGQEKDAAVKRSSSMWKAGLYLDRAEYFYQKIQDQAAVLQVCAKKAILAQLRGDVDMAKSLASKVAAFKFEDG